MVGALAAGMGTASAFPDKPITVFVGAGAGGSTDAGARIVAKAMEKVLGKPMVVINKPGGGGSKTPIGVFPKVTTGHSFFLRQEKS